MVLNVLFRTFLCVICEIKLFFLRCTIKELSLNWAKKSKNIIGDKKLSSVSFVSAVNLKTSINLIFITLSAGDGSDDDCFVFAKLLIHFCNKTEIVLYLSQFALADDS